MIVLLLMILVCSINSEQVIYIKNNTDQPIDLTYKIPEYTEAILKLKKLPCSDQRMRLFKAILNDDADEIRLIAQAGINLDQEIANIRPLAMAIRHNKINAFRALLECGADYHLTCDSKKLVYYALTWNNLKMASILIEKGADFFCNLPGTGMDVMYYALREQKPDLHLISTLINKGYSLNNINYHMACRITHHSDVLNICLKKGLNPNMVDESGKSWSLLSQASYCGNYQSVKYLLEAGAHPNSLKDSPLSRAIQMGHIKVAELLQEYGATF